MTLKKNKIYSVKTFFLVLKILEKLKIKNKAQWNKVNEKINQTR